MSTMTPLQIRARAHLELRKRRKQFTPRHPALQEVYDRCRYNLRAFAEEFFPHYCRDPFSQMHEDMFGRDEEDLRTNRRNLRDADAAPRGSAKTTVRGFIKLEHDCVYRLEQFITIFSGTMELAEDRTKQLRDELEFNERIIEVFGPQVGTIWNQGNFITAPDIYSGAPGVRVKAASPTSQMRGIQEKGWRVSKIFCDDFEVADLVVSELQRQKTARRFFEDILKLGQPGTNVEMIGTLLHPESLLANLLKNPGFRTRKYQSVLQYADAEAIPLWQEWKAIFTNLDNANRVVDARAFFEAHEAAMLQGHRVLWPQRESYYDLMVMRVVEGETAFQVEKQNNPTRSEGHLFDMLTAGYFRMTPTGLLRRDGRELQGRELTDVVAYWDPAISEGQHADWSAVVVLATDAQGYLYVLDALMMHSLPPSEQDTLIVELLWRWRVRRFGCEANMFQSLALKNVQNALAQKVAEEGEYYAPVWIEVKNTRNKMIRISTLETPIKHKHLWFCETLPPEFLRQMSVFRPIDGADKDDGPDALEAAVRLIKHLVG